MSLRAIILLFSLSVPLAAQAPPQPLSLEQAEAIALKNHPQILASEANSLRSDQLIREQQAAYYPSINGNLSASQANLNSRIGAGLLTDSRLFNRAGVGLTLSQLITDSGRTSNLVASSKLQAEASRQDYQAARDDVILSVHDAYYGVLLAESLVNLSQETVKSRQTVLDQVTELTKNKLRSDLDLNFAQVNVSDAKLMLLRAQNNLNGAFATLNQALGSSDSTQYQLTNQQLPAAPPTDSALLVTDAFAHRPELASIRLQRRSNEKFAAAERDLRRPTVSLDAVAGALPYINPGNANPNIPVGYEGIEVNVQVPIFNGHLFSARAKAAAYQVAESDQRIRNLQDGIAKDVRVAFGRAVTAHQAIATTQQLLAQANSALDLAQGRYRLGLSSIVELTQAQLGQTQAQVEQLNSQYDYQQAYAALQYALGQLH